MAKSTRSIPGDETTHYVSARKKRGRPKAKLQPPLTPMIDVTFQLLIFFVISTQFRQLEGQIPGTLPDRGLQPKSAVKEYLPVRVQIVPRVDSDTGAVIGVFKVNGGEIIPGPKELYRVLKDNRKKTMEDDDIPLEIRPVLVIPHRFLLEAVNAGARAGYKKIGYDF